MAFPMRMRANVEGDAVVVRVLMTHPEETGLLKDKAGQIIPAHFIQSVTCKNGDKTVMTCDWGTAISKNPFLEFRFKGGKAGDKVTVSWIDNKGDTSTADTTVS
ncbi:putative sulfur oxidation protein SoxZ [Thiomonas arsenitoxydans]|jgi:sulfur-oxidizing protein SoxZ|uniref:Sulfur oxidation protein SoxZ n=2 Tax=Thiomonas TaxID=32012 RepID=D6CVG7_THIA3|nr:MULTISPECIES: thiosulfate oxidation carrier complex protein SoxZ [Thiomonas]MDE2175420.1 thiosulfate oxidation carrier complex protein SoxZ [Betaproteobacteria bacterium]OYV31899.1 MAG: thiosulfate oxidation carrier complex protein SoxZ [Thiomonas sp. 20-64-9]OZB55584.1 MAG: thiosulfate oxidation carrier complex protein SoxZ [Thiomonas sp. 15-63-373]OZB76639.1 MAG: thiosulfate oxidation carrier complex protein SoxZ [Thiomonas sp. 14-64-326]CQR45462.1 putative sulfur oxidation protein SoxZ [